MSGILQGLILKSILFKIFINYLDSRIKMNSQEILRLHLEYCVQVQALQ